jgi:hypothetical protein
MGTKHEVTNGTIEQEHLQYPIMGRSCIPHTSHDVYNTHISFATGIRDSTGRIEKT